MSELPGVASKGWASYTLLDTSTTDTLPLNHHFFRPLGMEHFYDSFALVSQISVRREALFFFLDLAALVITTVAVMKICYNSHRLITRSSRLVSGQQKAKKHKQTPTTTNPSQQNLTNLW